MENSPELRLAHVLSELAVAILTDKSLKADLERLCRVASGLVDECSGASISMLVEGEPSTVAVTDRVALHLDIVQYDNNEGPCVQALGGEMIRIGVVSNDERFPHFAAGAADTRVQSVLSTPVIDHGTVIGSLNMYSFRQNAFDEGAEHTALVIAAEVAHALIKSTVVDVARTTRDRLQVQHDESVVVSRAQGVLMALQDCSAAQADDLLRNASEKNGESLITTAERILSTVRQDDGRLIGHASDSTTDVEQSG